MLADSSDSRKLRSEELETWGLYNGCIAGLAVMAIFNDRDASGEMELEYEGRHACVGLRVFGGKCPVTVGH